MATATVTPRAERRQAMPLGAGAISGELRACGRAIQHGMLWDLSRAGACLLASGAVRLLQAAEQELELVLHPSLGTGGAVVIPVSPRWAEPHGRQMFVGLQFAAGGLPEGSFLDDFLQESWAA